MKKISAITAVLLALSVNAMDLSHIWGDLDTLGVSHGGNKPDSEVLKDGVGVYWIMSPNASIDTREYNQRLKDGYFEGLADFDKGFEALKRTWDIILKNDIDIQSAMSIEKSGYSYCQVSTEGLKCYKTDGSETPFPWSNLFNETDLENIAGMGMGYNGGCLINDDHIITKCSGDFGLNSTGLEGKKVKKIWATDATVCIIEEGTNKLICGGYDKDGMSSNLNKYVNDNKPNIKDFSMSNWSTCLLEDNGIARCFGTGQSNGADVFNGRKVEAIANSVYHTVGLDENGKIVLEENESQEFIDKLSLLNNSVSIVGNGYSNDWHFCALGTNNKVNCVDEGGETENPIFLDVFNGQKIKRLLNTPQESSIIKICAELEDGSISCKQQ